MNRNTFIAAVVLSVAAAGPVSAQEAESDAWMTIESTQTRAQVQADLARARQDGSLRQLSLGYLPSVAVSRPRDMVEAEVIAAGGVRLHAEAYDFFAEDVPAAGNPLKVAAR